MPLYHFHREAESGPHGMVEVDLPKPLQKVDVTVPLDPTAKQAAGLKRFTCTACTPPKAFAGAGVLSMHFKKAHPDLYKDKNSWRDHCDEFGDVDGDEE